jgi:hypothetical protein
MSYVIESGVSHHGQNPMWVVVERGHNDRDVAYFAMVERAHSMQVLYEPHGGRKLRVREIQR